MSKELKDWRIKLFGDGILLNGEEEVVKDVEANVEHALPTSAIAPTASKPVDEFFKEYDYIALFFGANYCPFCKKFAPPCR
jgi:thiol-disulfide isomerase/thioredoxin